VPSALTALQLADAKLQRLDRPQFVPLRRALSRDMDRLKALPFVDIVGMSLKLDQAQAAVDALPLAMDERIPPPAAETTAPADDSPWRRFLRELWGDAKQLIRIEVADRPAAPLVPPPQAYFLRENLKLRLLTARIALLARNDASFAADLAAAEVWLKQYFDTRAKPVQAMQATVKQLAASPMPGETPDLTRSLEALRVLRLAQDRVPSRGGAATPAAR
jgi:uroporphyrin-3 C-methyltransferase